jgi:hypothetical protein
MSLVVGQIIAESLGYIVRRPTQARVALVVDLDGGNRPAFYVNETAEENLRKERQVIAWIWKSKIEIALAARALDKAWDRGRRLPSITADEAFGIREGCCSHFQFVDVPQKLLRTVPLPQCNAIEAC